MENTIGDFSDGQKRDIIEKLTDAMVAIEGENMRPVTWVTVEEVKNGDRGIGGKPLHTEDVKALAAGTVPAKRYHAASLAAPREESLMLTSAGRVCASTLRAIGNTPVVQLCKLVGPDSARVLVKLEYYSPTGSYKDRMALAMIEAAEARGDLRPGMTVVEFSGGSTGSSLAFVCAVKGYRCHIVSSDAFAQEKLRTIRAFGAELTIIPSQGGKITPDLIPRMIEEARRLAQADDVYWTDQLNNADALDGYEQIGRELLAQADDPIHAFCAAVGIGGMLLGAARALRAAVSPARIVVLEPAESPLISRGTAGAHHVEGTGIGIVPPLLTPGSYDEVRAIAEHDARETARHLTRAEGIFAGASTGLNVRAALELARELGPGHTVATVAVDTGLKYLAGDLYSD